MSHILIIGAGGVGRVATYKCAQHPELFSQITLASRTVSKCDIIAREAMSATGYHHIRTAQVDADEVPQLIRLIDSVCPDVLLHVALPYQDLTIMEACLKTGVHYVDTANYEPKDEARFEYKLQWAEHKNYQQAGITGLLGCGFDPGVTQAFVAHAAKHHFDEMLYLDIVDCNAGDHGHPFATNFNPEINIREITQPGRYYEDGQWIETKPHEIHQPITYPDIGSRESYLIYHEELESLVKHFPTLRRARFWMTFGQEYLTHLRVIQNIGMAGIEPVHFQGRDIIPLEFLKAVLPDPGSLGENYSGQTSIGCRIRGIRDGQEKTYYIWNNCSHEAAYRETGAQGVSYTTGVPAALGAAMVVQGYWNKPGVWNVEQFDPDPFLERLGDWGLTWHERVGVELEV